MIKVVVFDLDDTLISEKKYIESGYQYISNFLRDKYKREDIELYEILLSLFEESPLNVFNRALEKLKIPFTQEHIKELITEYRNHNPQIEFFEDVLPLFKFLKSKEIKVGIITDGYKNAQRNKLAAVEANKYVDKIVVTDELGKEYWKPHPKAFEMIKEFFQVEYEEIIYIGDNPKKDFYISNTYPIKTIRIRRENGVYATTAYYKGVKEDLEVTSLKEIEEVITLGFK